MNQYIELENRFGAHNYKPLPLVLSRAKGCHVWDTDGNRYLDMMSAYSAVSHGHAHPRILKVVQKQAAQLSVVSRAFYSDNLGAFLQKACEVTGMERALPMNSGAEAVETSLKAARKWAYQVKGVAPDKAEIISCHGNFHGRTLAVLTMSTEEQYRADYGPFLPGFRNIEFGDADALRSAIRPNTAAFIVEPIQGEGGIIIPPDGYLAECAEICRQQNILLIFDEIQTGLGRTGQLLACDHDDVRPDGLILGKALGGGLYPISLFLSRSEIMDCFKPGDHGSTFGGNALAAAIGLEALTVIEEEELVENSRRMGEHFINGLRGINSSLISDIRGKGLFIGVEIDPAKATARSVCEQLMKHGVLSKETHETVVRFAPPLIISKEDIDQALDAIETTLSELTG